MPPAETTAKARGDARGRMLKEIRKRIFVLLEAGEADDWGSRGVDIFLVCLICLNVVAVILESMPRLSDQYAAIFAPFEAASVAVFTVEYLLRLWICSESRLGKYQHPVLGRIRYFFSPLGLVDLLAILPFYLSMFLAIDLRFLRVFRLLRLIKLTRYSQAMETMGSVLYAQRQTLVMALFVMVVLMISAASALYLIEREVQPEAFASIPRAMWWALVTLTTVGYGDVTPITTFGRVVGGFVTLLGLAMYALPSGIIASGFVQEVRKREFVVTWNMVAGVPYFKGLDAQAIARITEILEPRVLPARYTIVRRGEAANDMFFIVTGEVEVDVRPSPVRLGDGQFFGEIGLLKERLRQATVTTLVETRLLMLKERDFERLLEDHPDLRQQVTEVADKRLAAINPDPADAG